MQVHEERRVSTCRGSFLDWRTLTIATAALFIAATAATNTASAVTLTAPDLTVAEGEQVTATFQVDDLDGAIIAGFDLLLAFDAEIVEFVSADFGNALVTSDGEVPVNTENVGDGVIELGSLNLFGDDFVNQDGSTPFALFSVTFAALDLGVSPLTLTPNTLGSDVFFTDPLGNTLDETSIDGSIEVTAVVDPPTDATEPGAIALLAIGLVLLPVFRLRRR